MPRQSGMWQELVFDLGKNSIHWHRVMSSPIFMKVCRNFKLLTSYQIGTGENYVIKQ